MEQGCLGFVCGCSQAIAEVRRRRCKAAIESRRQEEFVALYEARLRQQGSRGGCTQPQEPPQTA